MTHPETAGLAEFAAILGRSPSYVTALKQADRLVLTADGKRVRVAESIARIEATRDESKRGVAERHAAARSAKQGDVAPAIDRNEALPQEGETSIGYQHWRERSERAKALAAERENEQAAGKLMPIAEVQHVVASALTVLRTRIETLPALLAPRLAAISEEDRVRGVLADEIEQGLTEVAREFGAMGKAA